MFQAQRSPVGLGWGHARIPPSPVQAVRVARSDAELKAVGRLRYDLFISRDGKGYAHADHCTRVFLEPVDGVSLVFLAGDAEGACLASLRMTRASDALVDPQLERELAACGRDLRPETTVVLSRMVVQETPAARAQVSALLKYTYLVGLSAGIDAAVLAARASVAPLFQRFGFVRAENAMDDPVAGILAPMTLKLRNERNLAEARSPLLRVLRDWSNPQHQPSG